VRADIGAPDDLPLVKADAAEPASLRSMCARAAVIITTVGPYQLHGRARASNPVQCPLLTPLRRFLILLFL
jgi:hypothetical protein